MANSYIGIDIGSISVKIVEVDNNSLIKNHKIINHQGDPQKILSELERKNKAKFSYYGIIGSAGQHSEIASIERGLQELKEECDVIISLGGESFVIYVIKNKKINNVLTSNRCAAGSGEFIVQQIARLNLSIDEAIERALKGNSIKLASRCSVHCKSDITHKLNRQEASIEDVLWSLHESIAYKIISLLDQLTQKPSIAFVIGGLSCNLAMRTALERLKPDIAFEVNEKSPIFEAYGASLLVKDNPIIRKPLLTISPKYDKLDPLIGSKKLVKIIEQTSDRSTIKSKSLVLGIDGGSTTTKATLIDSKSGQIFASNYTRTNGNPINATKECIQVICNQVGDHKVTLIGVTGSARNIIGAFVGTRAIYNEISAHARGALSFDNDVDTIFEIGGQDAKYIYLENHVPISYAMNAACSAGTGSFLEESAQGDLGVSVYDISQYALESDNPIQLKAECAAFINSDIRTALQEGYSRNDIIAGLVNSIVNNYLTKVKGQRKIGKKVFLQGGVAKNHSVAYAFAQAIGKEVIVPPFPELMGALGVSLMAIDRFKNDTGLFVEKALSDILNSEMKELNGFTCRYCDSYCHINRYEVGGRKFPFGGRCSKYENLWKRSEGLIEVEDFVETRNKFIFGIIDQYNIIPNISNSKITIAIPRALTVHSLLPLYYSFFKELGYNVIISGINPNGENKVYAPFCFPNQIAHGAILDLVERKQKNEIHFDYIFFPQIHKMPTPKSKETSYLCPITQSSPYVLKKAFPSPTFLIPTLDFSEGYRRDPALIEFIVDKLMRSKRHVTQAYKVAIRHQLKIEGKMRALGRRALNLVKTQDKIGIIIVGRSYNAFPNETSQSISRKISSTGIIPIPFDCLGDIDNEETIWYFSNLILKSVELAKKTDKLFILFVSNFGCSIDAFTNEILRESMGRKPYLKLDIDSHTADAGTQTRLEAFVDIISNYKNENYDIADNDAFTMAEVTKIGDTFKLKTSQNELIDLTDNRVRLHLPVFSEFHSDALTMVMSWIGFRKTVQLKFKKNQMDRGLHYTSGSECLPLPIYLGQLLEIYEKKDPDDIIGLFMISKGEPCVVTAYPQIFKNFIKEHKMENVFLFGPNAENDYYGLNKLKISRYLPLAINLADIMCEMYFSIAVVSKSEKRDILRKYWKHLIENSPTKVDLDAGILDFAEKVKQIDHIREIQDCSIVTITGDFFVRFDEFFYSGFVEKYAEKGIILKPANLSELVIYPTYNELMETELTDKKSILSKKSLIKAIPKCMTPDGRKFLINRLSVGILNYYEKKLRNIFRETGLLVGEKNDLNRLMDYAAKHIDLSIYGEGVLTIGKGIESMVKGSDGIILLGPFSCLPFRISEAILKPLCLRFNFPIISYETDGRPVPTSFDRLIDVHIQQVIRRKANGGNLKNFIPLKVIN